MIKHLTESERDYFEERAAIAEFDAGMPRTEAEAYALDLLKKQNRIPVTGRDALRRCIGTGMSLVGAYDTLAAIASRSLLI